MATKVFRKLQVFKITPSFREAVKLVEVPLDPPKQDEIRVKNIFAGVNASDINMTAARYFTDGIIPFDIGMEALGIVDSIGSQVSTKLKVGQPVMVVDGRPSGFSEYLYKPMKSLVPVPELKPNFIVANVNGLTAALGLDKQGRIEPNDKVLITAAAGGTGQIAVQWAKQRGCYVIGTTSSIEKEKFLKSLGVDLVINYRKQNMDNVLREKFPDGIDVIWETIGGETFSMLFQHLAIKGRMIVIGSTTTYQGDGLFDVPISNLNAKLLMRSQSLNGFMLTQYGSDYAEYLPKLISSIALGKIRANVDLGETTSEGKFFGLDQTVRAEEWLHSGNNQGKVVVQVQDA